MSETNREIKTRITLPDGRKGKKVSITSPDGKVNDTIKLGTYYPKENVVIKESYSSKFPSDRFLSIGSANSKNNINFRFGYGAGFRIIDNRGFEYGPYGFEDLDNLIKSKSIVEALKQHILKYEP